MKIGRVVIACSLASFIPIAAGLLRGDDRRPSGQGPSTSLTAPARTPGSAAPDAESASRTPDSISNGQALFSKIHCDTCHTPSLTTSASGQSAALSNQTANLFSDLLVHNMGSGLADNVTQGAAGPSEFRTAPLWGLGQRIFFLHDGRATPANGGLLNAIQQHATSGSEANAVISLFNSTLSDSEKQDLLNFPRSL